MFQGRPVIAVTPLYDPERQAAWVYQNYLDSLEEQGAIPLVPPFSQDPAVLDYFLEGCDGLLLTGGCDIDPGLYGQPPAGSQEVCPLRDRLDSALLAGMLERDRPVLGICRGFQLLNILLGGNLWQDLPTQRPSAVLHRMGLPYNRAAHRVDLEPERVVVHARTEDPEIRAGVRELCAKLLDKLLLCRRVAAERSPFVITQAGVALELEPAGGEEAEL